MAPLKILIIGNGIAGPTLATFLLLSDSLSAREKPHITIVERAPVQRSQGQNIDIRGAGINIIRKLGLETAIRQSTTGEEGVQWVDDNNAVWASIDADRTGKTATPTADIEILRGRLAELCYLRCKQISDEVKTNGGVGVEFIFGDTPESIEQDKGQVHVQFAKSGQQHSYDIVVGADGLQSQVRRLVWGTSSDAARLNHLGTYAAFFSIPRSSTDTNYRQWYHASGRRNIMLRPDKQNNRTTVFMFVVNDDQDPRFKQFASKGREALEATKDLMEEYFRNAGWKEIPRVLEEMRKTPDFYYDVIAQVKMELEGWSKGRVVLLGDAGYCASPFSGMGTTLALSGAYNLAGAILNHRPEDLDKAFEQYEAEMRPTVTRAQKLVPGMPHVVCPQTEWGVWGLNVFVYLIQVSGLPKLLFRFFGPVAANEVVVREYGFRSLQDEVPRQSEK